jgi:two-component system, chemotaxis family, protein-glutamate methylesterase/glutaminase
MAKKQEEPVVVAIGASAGGVEALTEMAAGLPRDLPCAVLVALHMPVGAPSELARILDRSGPLPAKQAVDGAPLKPGTISVAVPNRHLTLQDHRIVLSEERPEHGHRPAIDALFRSVAISYGVRAIGVLLSGVLDDGVRGLSAIKSHGGTTVAQSPADAHFPDLPRGAIQAGIVDREAKAGELGELLTELAGGVLQENGG